MTLDLDCIVYPSESEYDGPVRIALTLRPFHCVSEVLELAFEPVKPLADSGKEVEVRAAFDDCGIAPGQRHLWAALPLAVVQELVLAVPAVVVPKVIAAARSWEKQDM